ncbi:MAG: DUF4412 domain-containing protein [Bacteroidota bacterium]
MKKILSFIMIVTFIMGVSASAFSKDFKGLITYKISWEGMDMDASMAAMMPKLATLAIKGNMSKFEMNMGAMGKQVQIMNGDEENITYIIDMMGMKYYYVETEEDLAESMKTDAQVEVDIKSETKEVAGYECKKAVITVNLEGEEMLFTVYFTEEIESASFSMDNAYFQDIPGTLMEFEIEAGQGMTMKMAAISVEKKNISDSEFEVPEGFEQKTKDEMMQMGGGM